MSTEGVRATKGPKLMTGHTGLLQQPHPTHPDLTRPAPGPLHASTLGAPLTDGIAMVEGEEAYGTVQLNAWRYFPLDTVEYEHRTVLFGGPLLMCLTAAGSALANRRRRQDAERLAAPSWRPLGCVLVTVTSHRLLVCHRGVWWPIWHETIAALHADPAGTYVDLLFAGDPPYRLAGDGAAALASTVGWRISSSQ